MDSPNIQMDSQPDVDEAFETIGSASSPYMLQKPLIYLISMNIVTNRPDDKLNISNAMKMLVSYIKSRNEFIANGDSSWIIERDICLNAFNQLNNMLI